MNQRAHKGKTDLATVSVSGQQNVDTSGRSRDDIWRMSHEDPRPWILIETAKRSVKIGKTQMRVVHPAQPDRTVKENVLIVEHPDSLLAKGFRHSPGPCPVIVIAKHGIDAKSRPQHAKCECARFGIPLELGEKVAGQKHDVRLHRTYPVQDSKNPARIGITVPVNVGEVHDAQFIDREGQFRQHDGMPAHLHPAPFNDSTIQANTARERKHEEGSLR